MATPCDTAPVDPAAECLPAAGRRWWQCGDWLLLVLLVLAIYGTRLGTLTIRGEESRRARVACEMLETGDWIVPREQGTVFADRPPLGNWLIAGAVVVSGRCDAATVRFPTLLATLLTTLLVYAFSRTIISRAAAIGAAAAYATMGQVLELGRLAETEATFTLLLAAALLAWCRGYTVGQHPYRTWIAAYTLVALAALAKGLQAPVFFAASTIVFLVLRRDWRWLLGPAHLAGLAALAAVFGAWQVPFARLVDPALVERTHLYTILLRFADTSPAIVARHLATYPFEVAACMLPWSALLAGYCNRGLRQGLGCARVPAGFLATSIAVCFVPVWLAPGARGRYFMPLYPACAVLVGIVLEHTLRVAAGDEFRRLWQRFLVALASVGVLAGVVVFTASLLGEPQRWPLALPLAWAGCYLAATIMLGWLICAGAKRPQAVWLSIGAVSAACLLGITYTGVVVEALTSRAEDAQGQVARLREQLPHDARLVSLDIVHHLFRYHYQDPIPLRPWPGGEGSVDPTIDYFCFDGQTHQADLIPFAWEQIAVISCDRNRHESPRERVVVGRRLSDDGATAVRDGGPRR